MVATRTERLRRFYEDDGWTKGDTSTLIRILFEWVKASGLCQTSNKETLYKACHEVWPKQMYDDMWVTKTGDQISHKIGRLRTRYNQVQMLLELSDGMVEVATGKINIPRNWKMANKPPAFVYLRKFGFKDYDPLDYIFGDMKLALFSFEEVGNEDNPIVLD